MQQAVKDNVKQRETNARLQRAIKEAKERAQKEKEERMAARKGQIKFSVHLKMLRIQFDVYHSFCMIIFNSIVLNARVKCECMYDYTQQSFTFYRISKTVIQCLLCIYKFCLTCFRG